MQGAMRGVDTAARRAGFAIETSAVVRNPRLEGPTLGVLLFFHRFEILHNF